jgi:hypothetical protein
MADLRAHRGFRRGLARLPLIGGSVTILGNPTKAAEPITEAMLQANATSLEMERRFPNWERAGGHRATFETLEGTLWLDNPAERAIAGPARASRPARPGAR